jgi:enoyl-CoA hydratase/carnithine racemase
MTPPSPPTVTLERRERVAVVCLNRPDRFNALNHTMARELAAALDETQDAGALVLTGADERAFSAGMDLKEADTSTDEPSEEWEDLTRRVAELSMPTVAAVEGWCLGGGLALAAACDFRIAGADARLGLPEVLRGIFPSMGCTWRIPRLIGVPRALELLLLGDPVDAPTAHAWGLVTRVVDLGAALTAAVGLADRLAAGAPLAQESIKHLARRAYEFDTDEHQDLERAAAWRTLRSRDVREGVSAYLEKRSPDFTGS